MRRAHAGFCLALLILCGNSSSALADTEYRFAGSHNGQLYQFSLSVILVLNQDETAAQISVQPALNSFACFTIEICYHIEQLTVSGLGLALPVGTNLLVPLTETQVELLKTGHGQFSAAAVRLGVNRPWLADPESFGIGLVQISGPPPVPPLRTYLLAEGATGAFFETDLLVLNPNSAAVDATLTFQNDTGAVIEQSMNLPALSRHTIRLNTIPGLESTTVMTRVRARSDTPLAIERTMRWDATGYEGHTERASEGANTRWYFAEGAQGFFHTYLLLVNAGSTPNGASIRFLMEGSAPISRRVELAPLARTTIDLGGVPDLQHRSFGMEVIFDQPGLAERATYVGDDPLFSIGHGSAGGSLATAWLLAEGATGDFFETFVLVANPNDVAADLTVRYFTADGSIIKRTHQVPGSQRLTINLEAEGSSELANTSVSTLITSTVPVVVERVLYWPGSALQWTGAHASLGANAASQTLGLAEGRVGGPQHHQTFILLANVGVVDATTTIRFVPEGGMPLDRVFVVPALSRMTVAIGLGMDVPELQDVGFGAYITATAPIVVERSMYWDARGMVWAAGANALGTAFAPVPLQFPF
jgi:hypothetical protein